MSRIGNKEIVIPENVNVNISNDNFFSIEGPKGKLEKKFNPDLDINIADKKISVKRRNENKKTKMIHGTTTSIINNMIKGVKEGFKIELEIVGVGYKARMNGNKLILSLGFSHDIEYSASQDIQITVPSATNIIIEGIDKEKVGETAANIRAYKKPEPYKGKGIKYKDEKIIRKEGKTASKK